MKYVSLLLLFCLLCLAVSRPSLAQDAETFDLNVRFSIAVDGYDTDARFRAHVDGWLDRQIAHAENKYGAKPTLNIEDTRIIKMTKSGIDLTDLYFDDTDAANEFMDTHFDAVATSKTTGYFQVLVTNKFCVGTYVRADGSEVPDCFLRGRGFLPHNVRIGSRKTGAVIVYNTATMALIDNVGDRYNDTDWLLAHEFGHIFGLIHTFSTYQKLAPENNCNRNFLPKSTDDDPALGYCNACSGLVEEKGGQDTCLGRLNIMDYCAGDNATTYLNSCQIDRAAQQRKIYSTSGHYTNYNALAGKRGGEACKKDGDCSSDQFCDKGTLTLGKNYCKAKRVKGAKCTRKKQCESDKCPLGKCK